MSSIFRYQAVGSIQPEVASFISKSSVDGVEDENLGCQFLDVALDELEEFPLKFVSILVLLRVPAPEDGSQVGGAGGDLAQAELG